MYKFSVLVVIVAAIILHIKLIYEPEVGIQKSEVESAIRRAKTRTCKKELREFANRISFSPGQSNQILKRTCKLDRHEERIRQVGCVTNSTDGLIKLDDELIDNSGYCLEACFTFGHSFAGFDGSSRECFCGDEAVIQNSLTDCHDQTFDLFQVDYGLHNHRKSKLERVESSNKNQIRIAFLLILNGRSSLQIQRLLKSIYSARHLYYLHVDCRDDNLYNDLREALEGGGHENVILAKRRFSTIWGGPDLLRMMIDAIGQLSHRQWDYLIDLSGSDYPIKPLSEVENYLQNDGQRMIYLKSHNIKGYNFIKKQALDLNFYQCEDRVWRLGKRRLPGGIVFHGGSDWFALPRDFCLYILNNLANPKSLVEPLVQLFNYTLLPAESFFHTLALNSEFCDRFADSNLRLTNWKGRGSCKCQHRDVVDWCGCSPLVYRKSDWSRLEKTNHSSKLFFSRKFDPTVSLSIINDVDRKLVKRSSEVDDLQNNNRESYWQDLYYRQNVTALNFLPQFGMFALSQVMRNMEDNIDNHKSSQKYKLDSVHEYYNRDKFKGLILNYCDQVTCLQLLVERNSPDQTEVEDSHCLESGEKRLTAIEVNHGFDSGEKMFRNHLPLNQNSDLIVFNEWILRQELSQQTAIKPNSFVFSLLNPEGGLEVEQKVKIKPSPARMKYSLAQRLKVQKPMIAGLWTLKVWSRARGRSCLSYKFLVFDNRMNGEVSISQEVFDNFYLVSKACWQGPRRGDLLDDCSQNSWSLENRKMYLM